MPVYTLLAKDKTVPRFELGDERFAIFCLTAWLYRQLLDIVASLDNLIKSSFCQL